MPEEARAVLQGRTQGTMSVVAVAANSACKGATGRPDTHPNAVPRGRKTVNSRTNDEAEFRGVSVLRCRPSIVVYDIPNIESAAVYGPVMTIEGHVGPGEGC